MPCQEPEVFVIALMLSVFTLALANTVTPGKYHAYAGFDLGFSGLRRHSKLLQRSWALQNNNYQNNLRKSYYVSRKNMGSEAIKAQMDRFYREFGGNSRKFQANGYFSRLIELFSSPSSDRFTRFHVC